LGKRYNKAKLVSRFFFGCAGAKKKLSKRNAERVFRALRSTRRATRPPPRRLLKKAGENFFVFRKLKLFSSKFLKRGRGGKTFLKKFFPRHS
jgi:hypothetical protein